MLEKVRNWHKRIILIYREKCKIKDFIKGRKRDSEDDIWVEKTIDNPCSKRYKNDGIFLKSDVKMRKRSNRH